MRQIKNFLSFPLFIFGYFYFQWSKKYNENIYQSYVRIYCLTNGNISRLISNIKSLFWKNKNRKENSNYVNRINQDGYAILNNFLNENEIKEFYLFSKQNKCSYKQNKNNEYVFYDKKKSLDPTYFYNKNDILKNNNILNIIRKIKELKIAENYFKFKPYLVDVNMWWSSKSNFNDPKSAQEFHFDLDSIKWLKFFIYLTDVEANTGPHIYVKGTHKFKKKELIKQGYVRIPERQIKLNYENQITTICEKKGTLIIGDTSCFHKGARPEISERLIFECTFSNDLFGCKEINNLNNYL